MTFGKLSAAAVLAAFVGFGSQPARALVPIPIGVPDGAATDLLTVNGTYTSLPTSLAQPFAASTFTLSLILPARVSAAIKMRVSLRDLPFDLARIDAVRNVFDGRLMLEAATIWRVDEAMRAASVLKSFDPFWIEDPFPMSETQDLQRLKSTGLPLAGGEWAIGCADVEHIIETDQYDYLIFDLFRIGGVTPWLTASSMAVGAHYSISSHVNSELSVQLLCGLEGSLYAEVIDLGERFYRNALRVKNGFVVPPQGPGWGIDVDFDYLGQFEKASAGLGNLATRRRGTHG
jgi:mandelate racemase